MGTFVGTVVETGGRSDFWERAAAHGVRPARVGARVGPWVLVVAERVPRGWRQPFAQALSRELGTSAFECVVQTTVGAEEVRWYSAGRLERHLSYAHDQGWLAWEGAPAAWEEVFFFGDGTMAGEEGAVGAVAHPDLLDEDVTDEEVAEVRAAREAGDLGPVRRLLHLGSGHAVRRLIELHGCDPTAPDGYWRAPRRRGAWIAAAVAALFAAALAAGILTR